MPLIIKQIDLSSTVLEKQGVKSGPDRLFPSLLRAVKPPGYQLDQADN